MPSLTPLLACQDGTIYSLRESSIRHRLPLDSIPSALQLFRNDGGSSGESVVYGTFSGEIGLMRCSRAGPNVQWILQNPASKAAVTSLDFYDLKGSDDGLLQLIVGRDDGFVEVYELDNGEDDVNPPNLIFSQVCVSPSYILVGVDICLLDRYDTQNFHDSIAVVRGGVVGAVGYTEILVATQHGNNHFSFRNRCTFSSFFTTIPPSCDRLDIRLDEQRLFGGSAETIGSSNGESHEYAKHGQA